jgi:uncharacterized protein YyaL (SSP411 family)
MPWGAEAIQLARELDRPIFLSVGYATCYWCHVMERESFESVAIAERLNAWFVPVKVDREERPDVDHLFMQAVQLLNHGQGGWPMSVFVEPTGLRPFLAGTYFPPGDAFGRPGFTSVLHQVHGFWTGQRERIETQATELAREIGRLVADRSPSRPLDAETVARAVDQLMNAHDPQHGGFGGGPGRPKFPTPVNLELLMDAGWDLPEVKRAVVLALDRMAMGGIHDHVGGGFHRYSVDERWEVPHFEKMLYDNAQLLALYARAFERTSDPLYRGVAEGIIDWARRSMRLEGGAFASALDAEVDHREGLNYLWTPESITAAMTAAGRADEVPRVLALYGVDRGPNFQDPHHAEEPARSVLRLPERPDRIAAQLGLGEDEFTAWQHGVNEILLAARDQRKQPLRDDKVLAGWNGMMIAALAEAGRRLDLPAAIEDAATAARFVLHHLRTPDGRLARSWRGVAAPVPAALEDHARLAAGLLALHEATGADMWRDEARGLLDDAAARFRDEDGGWWDCEADRPDLFVRVRDLHDGAIPSGTAAVLGALVALAERTGEEGRLDGVVRGLRAVSAELATRPGLSPAIVLVLNRLLREHAGMAAPLGGVSAPGAERAADAGAGAGAGAKAGADAKAGPGAGVNAAAPDEDRPAADDAVSVTCSHAEVRLSADRIARATVVLSIGAGLHVHAHEPGQPGLAGLDLELEDAAGVELEVDHPPGRAHAGPLGETRIHTDAVAIPLRFRRTGPVGGTPRLIVRVQACSDTACRAPQRIEVPVRFVVV